MRQPPRRDHGPHGDRRPPQTKPPTSTQIPNPACDPNSKYYSVDGFCNNLYSPNLGNFLSIILT